MLGNVLSWMFSTFSNIVFLFVFLPQLLENIKNKSSESISFYLLLLWYIGDTFSVMSVFYMKATPMLIYIGVYHIIFDIIFITQVLYYRLPHYEYYPLLMNENLTRSDFIYYIKDVLLIREVTLFLGYNIVLICSQRLLNYIPHTIIGNIFAWLSTIIFLISRLPQIILNEKRQSVQGLSFITFLNISIANILFLLSILIYLLDIESQSLKIQYTLNNLPWIIGSSGTIFFDIIIFLQFCRFNDH